MFQQALCLTVLLQVHLSTGYQTSFYMGYGSPRRPIPKFPARVRQLYVLPKRNYDLAFMANAINNGIDVFNPLQSAYGSQLSGSQNAHRLPKDYSQFETPQVIDIEAPLVPLVLNFHTRSSKIMAFQNHIPNEKVEVNRTESYDEPRRLIHVVLKPIIQEVREIISPYRRITQVIKPVKEVVHLLIASKEQKSLEVKPLSSSGLLGGIPYHDLPSYKPSLEKKLNVKQ